MKPTRDAAKAAVRFHARWLRFLLRATPQTMRRVAHELAQLEEENRSFRDGAIFGLLRHQIEFVIGDVTRSNWTVERSRRDLRRNIRRRGADRRHFHVDGHVLRALGRRSSAIRNLSSESDRHD